MYYTVGSKFVIIRQKTVQKKGIKQLVWKETRYLYQCWS